MTGSDPEEIQDIVDMSYMRGESMTSKLSYVQER